MTDAPMTRKEVERLLAMCAADGAPVLETDDLYEVQRRTTNFADAARTALPRALREVLRLQDSLKCWQEVAEENTEQWADRKLECDELKAEVASLRRTLDAVDRVLRSEG